nr:hypothetical protein [uncultured Cetobacterium sp.]
MYKVTRAMLIEALERYIKLAEEMDGELVVLNKVTDEADEFVITSIKDFDLIPTKDNDLIEITIYVDDEDEVFEEFVIGDNSEYERFEKDILSKLPKVQNSSVEKKSDNIISGQGKIDKNKDKQSNHFQKFMKKK